MFGFPSPSPSASLSGMKMTPSDDDLIQLTGSSRLGPTGATSLTHANSSDMDGRRNTDPLVGPTVGRTAPEPLHFDPPTFDYSDVRPHPGPRVKRLEARAASRRPRIARTAGVNGYASVDASWVGVGVAIGLVLGIVLGFLLGELVW